MHARRGAVRTGFMDLYRRLALPVTLTILLAACAPPAGDPEGSASHSGHDMASMSATPRASASPSPMASASWSPSADEAGMHHGGSGGAVTVDIANFAFAPSTLTITAGTEVVFTNVDAAPHTVTAGSDDEPMPERFESGLLQRGESFRIVFEEPGTYAYYCERHPPMTGTVVVEP